MSGVSALFDRALRRKRIPFEPLSGPVTDPADGALVWFHTAVEDNRLCRIEYRCTTCVTLVAACEAIVERSPSTVPQALAVTAEDLLVQTGGVPPMRAGRFRLAVEAFRAEVARTVQDINRNSL